MRILATPNNMDDPDITAEEWLQRAALMAESAHETVGVLLAVLKAHAPILLQHNSPSMMALLTIDITLNGLRQSALDYMKRHGIEPLNLHEEQLKVVRSMLAQPGLDEETRAELLELLAAALNEVPAPPAESGEDAEWPTDLVETEQ